MPRYGGAFVVFAPLRDLERSTRVRPLNLHQIGSRHVSIRFVPSVASCRRSGWRSPRSLGSSLGRQPDGTRFRSIPAARAAVDVVGRRWCRRFGNQPFARFVGRVGSVERWRTAHRISQRIVARSVFRTGAQAVDGTEPTLGRAILP